MGIIRTEIEKPAVGTDLRKEDASSGSASHPVQQAHTINIKDLLKDIKTHENN
ncbi:MAG: hypothetical protein H7843_06765 [Nitrospirota bacterium]